MLTGLPGEFPPADVEEEDGGGRGGKLGGGGGGMRGTTAQGEVTLREFTCGGNQEPHR